LAFPCHRSSQVLLFSAHEAFCPIASVDKETLASLNLKLRLIPLILRLVDNARAVSAHSSKKGETENMPTRKPRIVVINVEGGPAEKYAVYPSTEDFIKKKLRRAQVAGVVKGREQMVVCRNALIGAGILEARAGRASKVVTRRDVQRGYDKYLRAAPVDCPMYRCFEASILKRVETLKAESPVLRTLLTYEK
jgi:hypothetical protein